MLLYLLIISGLYLSLQTWQSPHLRLKKRRRKKEKLNHISLLIKILVSKDIDKSPLIKSGPMGHLSLQLMISFILFFNIWICGT